MLWQILLSILVLWYISCRWKNRRLFQLAKQIKCDIKTLPIIGHAHLFLGDGVVQMDAIRRMGREAIKQGGMTHGWLGMHLFVVAADVDVLELVMMRCHEKDDFQKKCINLAIDNGSIIAPGPRFMNLIIKCPVVRLVACNTKNLDCTDDFFSTLVQRFDTPGALQSRKILRRNMHTFKKEFKDVCIVGLEKRRWTHDFSVPIWRPRRKIMVPIFNQKNLKHYVDTFSKQSRLAVDQIKQIQEGSFSIWDFAISFSINSVCETTLGIQSHGQPDQNKQFAKAVDNVLKLIVRRLCAPWLHPSPVYRLTRDYTNLMKYKETLKLLITKTIKSKREALKINNECAFSQKESEKDEFKSLLELLIESSGRESGYTDTELLEELLVLVIAATDTSAVATSFTILMLASHLDVQEKVYRELLEVIGDTDGSIVAEDLPRLKYMDAVIKETLRLYPSAPLTGRKILEDITLPSGLTLVKGCNFTVHMWATHRNPKYWGADAEEFRPERFFAPYDPRAFVAFSCGPRNCVGYRYAMMTIKVLLVALVLHFRFLPALEKSPSGEIIPTPIRETYEFMMKDAGMFKVRRELRI